MKTLKILLACTLLGSTGLAKAETSYDTLFQDESIVTDVRIEDENVWIKLAPAHISDNIVVRISNRNKDFYRPWFTGDVDLVSSGFRGRDTWSDRVQTEAKFIEYWTGDTLILHLERK